MAPGPASGPTPPDRRERGGGSAALDRATLTSVGIWVIALAVIVAALDYASAIAIPTVLAALAAIALTPLAQRLEAARLPASLATGLIVLGVLGGTAATLYALAPSAEAWTRRAPEALRTLEIRAREISGALERSIGVDPTPVAPPVARRVAGPDVPEPAAETTEKTDGDAVDKLVEGGERLMTDLAISAPRFVGGSVYWAVLTFFLLRDRASLARSLLALGPDPSARRALGRAMRDVQLNVSRYLLAITLINIGLGASVAAAFALLGVPNAGLWGVAAGLANFMPFIGAAAMTLVTLAVGIVSFEDPAVAFAPVVALVALNSLEGQVITPLVIGARMRLSTVGVFIGIAFGAWLWGAAGALIATPSLIVAVAFLTRLAAARASRSARQREGGGEGGQSRQGPGAAADARDGAQG